MSLVGTLAKVALGVAAAKGVSMVVAQAAQPTSMKEPDSQPRQGDTLSSVVGGKGQAGGGLGSPLEQLAMAAGAGGSSGSGATVSAPTGGLDALIKGPGAATKGTINKAPVEGCRSDRPIISEIRRAENLTDAAAGRGRRPDAQRHVASRKM